MDCFDKWNRLNVELAAKQTEHMVALDMNEMELEEELWFEIVLLQAKCQRLEIRMYYSVQI